MKKKYIYLVAILIILIFLYILFRGLVSYKKIDKNKNSNLNSSLQIDEKLDKTTLENQSDYNFKIENTILKSSQNKSFSKLPSILEENIDYEITQQINRDTKSGQTTLISQNPKSEKIIEEKNEPLETLIFEISNEQELELTDNTSEKAIEINVAEIRPNNEESTANNLPLESSSKEALLEIIPLNKEIESSTLHKVPQESKDLKKNDEVTTQIVDSKEQNSSSITKTEIKKNKLLDQNILKKSYHLNKLAPLFLYKILTKNDDDQNNLSFINQYHTHNFPFISFTNIPKPFSKEKIDKHTLGEIIVSENKYTSTEFLKKRIKIKPGDEIIQQKLQEHLNFINLNPFRNVEMLLEPKDDNTSDIELICHDRFPLRVYVGTDNTGLKIIDRSRVYGGFNWNRAFALDSILSYQYLASYNFKKFQAHTAHYSLYLPWENILTLFGSYAQIEVDHLIPLVIKNKGTSSQASIRYDILLPIIGELTHDFILGFDFKRTDTNLTFSRFLATDDTPVNLSQFLLSYSLNWQNEILITKVILELYASFGEWLPDQENHRYNSLRRFSQNQYVYTKGYVSTLFNLPKSFLFSLMLRAQLASENLLPSETFGIGGYNTVRGYYERALNTDNGIIINAEIRTPSISILPRKNYQEELRFIAFIDYGLGSIHKTLPFDEKTNYLLGFGPGIRYSINPYLALRLDWGIKAHRKAIYGGGNSMIHFSLNLSY